MVPVVGIWPSMPLFRPQSVKDHKMSLFSLAFRLFAWKIGFSHDLTFFLASLSNRRHINSLNNMGINACTSGCVISP